MKQVFMRKNPLGEANIIVEEVPAPGCGNGDVLIGNRASLISAGTEMASVRRNMKDMVVKAMTDPDLRDSVKDMLLNDGIKKTADRVHYETTKWTPMGYSGCGVAVDVGTRVEGIAVGDMVAYGGQGHAELIRVAKNLCVRVPDGVTAREASFVALGSIALQAVRRAEINVGEVAVVMGLGLVGQLVCQLLHASGARVLAADLLPSRMAMAASLGAERCFSVSASLPDEIFRYTNGTGADRVMICAATSSSEVVEQAVAMARDRARIVVVGMVGLDIPCEQFYRKELDLVISRSYGPGRYDAQYEEHGVDYPIGYVRWTERRNMEEFLRLAQVKKIDLASLITHEFALENAGSAYATLSKHGADCLAVVLQYAEKSSYGARQVPVTAAPVFGVPRKGPATIAVVGSGAFARQFHLPNIKSSPELTLKTLVTSSAQSAKEMAARYGAAIAATDVKQMLSDDEIDAVAIFTRDNTHAEIAAAALSAGKHVFCEKPLAVNLEQCEQVTQAAANPGRVCMTGFNRRFAPLVRRARDVLSSGQGPLMMHYRINAGPLPGDNWVYDEAYAAGRIIGEVCHFVDLFRYFCGSEPTTVQATPLGPCGSLNSLEDVAATIEFSDGSVGNLIYTAAGNTGAGKERLEIFAGGTTVMLDDFTQLRVRGRQRIDERRRHADKGHGQEMTHFARVVTGKELPEISVADGIQATLCCLAIVESARTSRAVPVTPLNLETLG